MQMAVPCWECGKPATTVRGFLDVREFEHDPVTPFHRCYCDRCKAIVEENEKADRELYIKLRKKEMFLKACNLLEDQGTKMYDYKEAIDVVYEFLMENLDRFDSSYEVLAAIVLIHNRIYVKTQHKIGRYQVDFLLPDLMVVLEIDGERHKHKQVYDTKRDLDIKRMLGDGWDIIRIPTEHLDRNAKKLPEAIYKVIEYRQVGRVDWRSLYDDK